MNLVFDIGGSNTRVAVSENGKDFLGEPRKFATPKEYAELIENIAETARELSHGSEIQKGAGGIAGSLSDEGTHHLLGVTPNIPRLWQGKDLAHDIKEACGVVEEIYLENDTALVGLGEIHRGAGSSKGIIAYVTVSTGVGGARYIDGVIDTNRGSFEVGHQIIDADGTMCPNCSPCKVCKVVDLESMISGSGVERRLGKKPYEIAQSDALWNTLASWLAVGLNNTIVSWTPEKIVLGGSMMVGNPRIPLEETREKLADLLTIYPRAPELVLATLGDFGGLHGGLILIEQKRGEV